jgi:hypothetical protein
MHSHVSIPGSIFHIHRGIRHTTIDGVQYYDHPQTNYQILIRRNSNDPENAVDIKIDTTFNPIIMQNIAYAFQEFVEFFGISILRNKEHHGGDAIKTDKINLSNTNDNNIVTIQNIPSNNETIRNVLIYIILFKMLPYFVKDFSENILNHYVVSNNNKLTNILSYSNLNDNNNFKLIVSALSNKSILDNNLELIKNDDDFVILSLNLTLESINFSMNFKIDSSDKTSGGNEKNDKYKYNKYKTKYKAIKG